MPIQSRQPFRIKGPGPYLAIVRNHLDSTLMGGLEVSLVKGYVGDVARFDQEAIVVRRLSPFYGTTSVEYQGQDPKDYNDVQKAYGMWFVPPDLGTQVMVIFINGDPNMGFWIGCVQDKLQNQTIPGIAAAEVPVTDLSSEQITKYGNGVTYLPVGEFLKDTKYNPPRQYPLRPVHPFADRLASQGLLKDRTRGVTSSSARREIPSSVFGISTPGPIDKSDTGKEGNIEYGGKKRSVKVSRLGGHTFVMDDGDEYGNNELVRIRTRTGNQILLHDTQGLIYIANADGTAWIELTKNGKIDIFAQDSISVHTEQDFNLRAGRNFNIEAGNNVNIKGFKKVNVDSESVGLFSTKSLNLTSVKNISVASETRIDFSSADVFVTAGTGLNLLSGDSVKITAGQVVGIAAGGGIRLSSPSIKNNDRNEPAKSASQSKPEFASILQLYSLPFNQGSVGWDGNSFFAAGTLSSIMQRVPTHEPWAQHEELSTTGFAPEYTDNEAAGINVPVINPALGATDPTAVDSIVFTSGSGDASHFAKLVPEMQKAVQDAAISYKQKTGRPMIVTSAFRSVEEQRAIYKRWKDAGGDPVTKPKAAGIMVPVNPDAPGGGTSTHFRGVGLDTPNAPEMERLGILDENNLYRPVPAKDPVHIVLKGVRNTNSKE